MAQLLLQQGKVTEALKYFERAAELSRTEGEIVNALSYAEATRTQLEVLPFPLPIPSPFPLKLPTNTLPPGPRKVPPACRPSSRHGYGHRRIRHAINPLFSPLKLKLHFLNASD